MENTTNASVFLIGEAFRFGWETTKKHLWLFAGSILVLAVASGVINQITKSLESSGADLVSLVVRITGWLGGAFVQLMIYKAVLSFVDGQGQPKTLQELFPKTSTFWSYFGATILFFIGGAIGTILLIVPGIMFAIACGLYGYIITEEMNIGPVAALKHSAVITKGFRWQLFGLALTMLGVVILGAIALGVGLLVAAPVCMITMGYVYRKLSNHASSMGKVIPVQMLSR